MPRIEPPTFSLVVLVAIEPPAGDPLAALKCALIHGSNSHLLSGGRTRRKRDSEPLACAQKLIRTGGHDEPKPALRVGAEEFVQRDVKRISTQGEIHRGMIFVEYKTMHVAGALVFKK